MEEYADKSDLVKYKEIIRGLEKKLDENHSFIKKLQADNRKLKQKNRKIINILKQKQSTNDGSLNDSNENRTDLTNKLNNLKRAYEDKKHQAQLMMDENYHLNALTKQLYKEKEAAVMKHIQELEEIEVYFKERVFHSQSRVKELEHLLLTSESKNRKRIDEYQIILEEKMTEIENLYNKIVHLNNSAQADRRKNTIIEMNLKTEMREVLDYSEKLTEDFIKLANEKEELFHQYSELKNSKLGKVQMKFLSLKNGMTK